jgi:hypothetical protein
MSNDTDAVGVIAYTDWDEGEVTPHACLIFAEN